MSQSAGLAHLPQGAGFFQLFPGVVELEVIHPVFGVCLDIADEAAVVLVARRDCFGVFG